MTTENGEIYDLVSPSTPSARNISSPIQGKVESGQTQNVVVNLADTSVTPSQLRQQLTEYPVPGVKSVVVLSKELDGLSRGPCFRRMNSPTSSGISKPVPKSLWIETGANAVNSKRSTICTRPGAGIVTPWAEGQWWLCRLGDEMIEMGLGEVLNEIEQSSWKSWVFIQNPKNVSVTSRCLVIDTSEAEMGSDGFTPLQVEKHNMVEFLSIADLRDVVQVLGRTNLDPSTELKCLAVAYYFEHDAFMPKSMI